MTTRSRETAVVLLALVALARDGGAQTPLEKDCATAVVASLSDADLGRWKGARPEELKTRLEPLRRAGRWSDALDSLAAIYLLRNRQPDGASPPASLDGLSPPQVEALFAEVDSLRRELADGERDQSAALRGAITLGRFDLRPPPPVGNPSYTLFHRRGATVPVVADDRTPSDTRRSVCWFAIAARDLATMFGGPGRERLMRALNARVERWDNFSKRGYSMLPHELLVNGFLPRPELEPPRVQLVIAHPSAGAEMAGETLALSKLKRLDVLALEPAGVLVYGPQHRWYAGASLVLTFPGSANAGAGVMAHLGPVGRAAYVWHGRDTDGRRRKGVLLSLDLYRYLSGAAERWKKLKAESVAECLQDAQACAAATP